MPLYSYICETCGEFEGWQSMSQSLEPVGCDRCGNLAPRAPATRRRRTNRRWSRRRATATMAMPTRTATAATGVATVMEDPG